jgi:hypothetical protein
MALKLDVARVGNDLTVSPWPFGPAEIELMIPVCRVRKTPFESDEALQAEYCSGPAEVLTCRVTPAGQA